MAKNNGLHFYKRKKKISSSLIKEILSWIFGALVTIFIAGVSVWFLGMTTNVVGISMEPVLDNGQKILVNRFQYILSSPKRGHVIVFLPNGNENSHYYVKRVVAIPGDKVVISDGKLYVNGETSTYVDEKIVDAGIAENEFVLQAGEYFCIGDNANNSEDSRSANIGAVKDKDIIGRAWFKMRSSKSGFGFIK